MTLPRGYWCQVIYTEPDRPDAVVLSTTTGFPGRAVTWLRATVRKVAVGLDREAFGTVWAWLGDHHGASTTVQKLSAGVPYTARLGNDTCPVWLVVHPVSYLPLIDVCTSSSQLALCDPRRAWALGQVARTLYRRSPRRSA